MSSYAFKISIVVPVAPWEKSLSELEKQLKKIDNKQMDFEVILAHAHESPTCQMSFFIPKVPVTHIQASASQAAHIQTSHIQTSHIQTETSNIDNQAKINGRAHLMNIAAEQAQGEFIWFLHLDSHLSPACLSALKLATKIYPKGFLYFNLAFSGGHSWLMRINQWGVYLRSHLLNMPFGDQGFCMHRDTFFALGGYNTACDYGEDHLLVWQALQAKVALHCTDEYLVTSARKYMQQGWFKTTCKHVHLWLKQAWPQYKKLRHLNRKTRV